MDLRLLQDLEPWEWPPDAGARLLNTLRDAHAGPNDRLLAAELAGDTTVINDEIAAALLSIVRASGEPEPLRAKAVISLGPALELADEEETAGDFGLDDSPLSKRVFGEVRRALRDLYLDAGVPKLLRRRILEASVRAPQDWHPAAVRSVYASEDQDWKLTAVFCMGWIKGFDAEIVEALESPDPDIHYEAVCAAGNWEVDAAWPHVAGLVTSGDTDKPLLLAAIAAVSSIRPEEARAVLGDLTDSDDEDISEAAFDALTMAEGALETDFDEEDVEDDDLLDDLDFGEDDDDDEENDTLIN